ADGARSRLRELAGVPTFGWSYGQSAIACTVAHERDHGGRAEEHFLPAGPFAILPLNGRRSSIVWTEEARGIGRAACRGEGARAGGLVGGVGGGGGGRARASGRPRGRCALGRVLRSPRDRRPRRQWARPWRPCRGTFPPRRSLRDPAA